MIITTDYIYGDLQYPPALRQAAKEYDFDLVRSLSNPDFIFEEELADMTTEQMHALWIETEVDEIKDHADADMWERLEEARREEERGLEQLESERQDV